MAPIGMAEPTYLILAALADQPRHGYGVVQEVAKLSDGRVQLRTGTLYAALDRLEQSELIEAAGTEIVDGRLRRYYALTDSGATALTEESSRLKANVAAANKKLKQRSRSASRLRPAQ